MNSKQTTMVLLGAAVAAGILYAVYKKHQDVQPPSSVTAKDTGGLVTTPVNESRAAFLTNPLRTIVKTVVDNATKVKTYIVGSVATSASGDKMTPFHSLTSAVAAFVAPLRPDYAAKVTPSPSNAPNAEVSRAGNSFQFN